MQSRITFDTELKINLQTRFRFKLTCWGIIIFIVYTLHKVHPA